jgi:hypothetical protein
MTTGKPSGSALTLIHRQVSFRLAAFDRLKDYQRGLERTEGRPVTNSEALDRLILSHPLLHQTR